MLDAGPSIAGAAMQPAVGEVADVRSRLRWMARVAVGGAWLANIGLLIVAAVWIFGCGESRGVVELLKYELGHAAPQVVVRDPSRIGVGVKVALAAGGIAACAWVVMLGSLFGGSVRFRALRVWFVLMGVTCGWLGLVVGWQSVYWFGQQQRMKAVVPAATELVEKLKINWPSADSALPSIGPFLAYPLNGPTALLPLSEATFPKSGARFSAVERTGDGVMRFELAGSEAGAWLEWRGDGSEPAAFVGGLSTEYVVAQVARLAPEWFLVRYRAAGLVERGAGASPQAR
jgi:hypothetical protein